MGAVQMNPNFTGYCCRNPKGPHKFPRGHPRLPHAEQNVAAEKANVAAEKANVAAEKANNAAESESTDFPVPSSVGDGCDFATGGAACCNGKGQEVIGTLEYCKDLTKYGECYDDEHSCFAVQMNPNFTGYCCRNPKGPHKFPKGHPRLPHAEQNVAAEKANVASESESTDFPVPSSVGDGCDFEKGGAACCNGKGQKVIGDLDYCKDLTKYGE